MLTNTLIIFALLLAPDIEPSTRDKAWIQDNEVWIKTDAGERRVIYDPTASYPIASALAGDRVAYAVPDGRPVQKDCDLLCGLW